MREIKFRQPLFKPNGKFFRWHYWGDIDDGFVSPVCGNIGRNSLEYTGLKDSKGVEIYEGDVLKYSIYDEERTGVIKYEDKWAQFYLSTKNKYGVGVGLTSVHSWYYNNSDNDETDVEIIGNIYENPELLQTTNDPG